MTVLRDCLGFDQSARIISLCSSHPMVLSAAMAAASASGDLLLVEATANQVNQNGGYTGMTPADFRDYVERLAQSAGLEPNRVVLGADHLGPHIWRKQAAHTAMAKALVLVCQCVAAGFRKIHIDTAVGCANDKSGRLPPDETVRRAVSLCLAAEKEARRQPGLEPPVYVVGHEVPFPGGGLIETGDAKVTVTSPGDVADLLLSYEKAFCKAGLESAWKRVAAVVVQPGVDFGDWKVAAYQREKAAALSAAGKRLPGGMVYEVHAADYQTPGAVDQMFADRFSLLKIGPCLTFAFREAVYALAHIEQALPNVRYLSNLKTVMDKLMLADPRYWEPYLEGDAHALYYLRHFSLRDRIRYYWSRPEATRSLNHLLQNLSRPLPVSLLRQYFPDLSPEIESGRLDPDPRLIIRRRIEKALSPYFSACRF